MVNNYWTDDAPPPTGATQRPSDPETLRCTNMLHQPEPVACEVETDEGWLPVCQACMDDAWERGYRVRKAQGRRTP